MCVRTLTASRQAAAANPQSPLVVRNNVSTVVYGDDFLTPRDTLPINPEEEAATKRATKNALMLIGGLRKAMEEDDQQKHELLACSAVSWDSMTCAGRQCQVKIELMWALSLCATGTCGCRLVLSN